MVVPSFGADSVSSELIMSEVNDRCMICDGLHEMSGMYYCLGI
jgi:hypothetical protein